jgi:predicted site-specific integrase-resolvase
MIETVTQSYASRRLGVSRQHISQYIIKGKIPCIDVMGTKKIDKEWFEAYVKTKCGEAQPSVSVEAAPVCESDSREGAYGGV